MNKEIAVIRGDGIGPEIVAEALKVLDRVADVFGHSFHYVEAWMGGCALDRFGDPLPEQELRIRAAGLPAIRSHLMEAGIDPGAYEENPYTGLRELRFTGPDNVRITITEAE